MSTKIDWTDETLTVSTGCRPISAGCDNCYAEKMHKRLNAMGVEKYKNPFNVITLHPKELEKPFKWKKPRMIFINSMSDLFHKDVPDEFIFKVFAMMNNCQRHTFQVLTKRPERLLKGGLFDSLSSKITWTDNIWLGVSVESEKHFSERVLSAMMVKVLNKFISFEPLIDNGIWLKSSLDNNEDLKRIAFHYNWMIVGGETGAGARPMEEEWVDELFEISRKYNIPFFFKGWGTATMKKTDPGYYKYLGREWREMPKEST